MGPASFPGRPPPPVQGAIPWAQKVQPSLDVIAADTEGTTPELDRWPAAGDGRPACLWQMVLVRTATGTPSSSRLLRVILASSFRQWCPFQEPRTSPAIGETGAGRGGVLRVGAGTATTSDRGEPDMVIQLQGNWAYGSHRIPSVPGCSAHPGKRLDIPRGTSRCDDSNRPRSWEADTTARGT